MTKGRPQRSDNVDENNYLKKNKKKRDWETNHLHTRCMISGANMGVGSPHGKKKQPDSFHLV